MASSLSTAQSDWVAGADGCSAGWVVVLRNRVTGLVLARVEPNFSAVLAMPEAPIVIAVDVPIGLLTTAVRGGRACDVGARRLVGPRRSSVFSAPSRAALACFKAGGNHQAVSAANRGGVANAPGLSRQTFSILPKIDEVDQLITPPLQSRVFEVHPERCFREANGGVPMANSKRKIAGRQERGTTLQNAGFAAPMHLLGTPMLAGAKPDDLIDACVACWSADRIALGRGVLIPPTPPTDARGLRMEMWR